MRILAPVLVDLTRLLYCTAHGTFKTPVWLLSVILRFGVFLHGNIYIYIYGLQRPRKGFVRYFVLLNQRVVICIV